MSDKPILHGVSPSPFVRKVRVALAEKGIAYHQVPVMPFAASEEFLAMSPLRKIPVYQEGDFTLPDSSAILAYLERVQPKPPLYPADARQFARALWYEEYADTKLVELIGAVFFNRVVAKIIGQAPDEAAIAKGLAGLPAAFDYLERELGDREVLAGTLFSVADIAVSSMLVNLAHAGETVDPNRWPGFAAYIARNHARPSFKQTIEEEKTQLPAV
jgi:glutathione S-transferase